MDNSKPFTFQSSQQKPNSTTPLHKIPPMFKKKADWRCTFSSDITYINKCKLKMLSHISIKSLLFKNIDSRGIRNLRKALTDTKRISSLDLDDPELNSKQLAYLLDSTNHWTSLQFFVLKRTERLNPEFIKALSRVGRCKKLSHLPFSDLRISQHVNQRETNRLCHQIRVLNQCKTLNLDIPLLNNAVILNYRPPWSLSKIYLHFKRTSESLDPQQLSRFVSSFKRCSLLQEVSLTFSQGCPIRSSDAQI